MCHVRVPRLVRDLMLRLRSLELEVRRPELRVLRWWDEHSGRATLTVSLYRRVDVLGVIGRVCRDPCQRALDLREHRGYPSRIASVAAAQITGGDITRLRIHDKVELAPRAVRGRRAQVPAMNPDPLCQ